MQPGLINYRKTRKDDGEYQEQDRSTFDFEQVLWRLAGGDIAQREEILWRVEVRTAVKWLAFEEESKRREIQWDLSKMEFLARLLGAKWRAPRLEKGSGEIGGYCKGSSLEECQRVFGEKLPEICATCPE